jgi:hypothetical protein
MLAATLAAAPQAKVIRTEAFAQSGATPQDATDATDEAKASLVRQGYRVDDKGAEYVLSGLLTKADETLIIDSQLSKADDRTLVAATKVACSSGVKACARDAAEKLGSKLRESTGVRVKLAKPDSRAR